MSEVDAMAQCPYNPAHMVLKHRLASHLIKCRQQHPTRKFEMCPFNATHHVPAPEIKFHMKFCPDRKQMENFIYVADERKPAETVQIDIPPSSENWDEERNPSGSYLDVKNKKLEEELVLRQPVGLTKTAKKEFVKKEVLRFGNSSK